MEKLIAIISLTSFSCSRCGACCSHLRAFGDIYSDLDDGNGICIFYDSIMHACLQYETRPLRCRIIEGYEFFKQYMSFEEYIFKTKQGCAYLQTLI
jgi:hypothetical protein